jgi:hypothetical protein
MTTLALFFALCGIALYVCAEYQRNRALNLEILNAQLRDDCVEMRASLDDAWRHVDKLQTSNSHLIREASTMGDDLARLERERAWLAAGYRHSKAVQATSMLYATAWQGMAVSKENVP